MKSNFKTTSSIGKCPDLSSMVDSWQSGGRVPDVRKMKATRTQRSRVIRIGALGHKGHQRIGYLPDGERTARITSLPRTQGVNLCVKPKG